ncbi:protein kinase [Polyangium jinanense]|uniref:serine/threonine-protein kinase n=1 Tax=Polyangium jinanense TaxID=2829994 RepID=UPI0023415D35|nr:serine/threonine-protein kinase [Polyangium jinanense]MDC3956058.1 protein kinase [Polyangium jinanense]
MPGEPLSGRTSDVRRDVDDDEDDTSLSSSSEDGDGAITPDPFLAKIARIPSRSAPGAPATLPRPGERVGRFVVREEIGRGGMGVVFAATDPTLGREVALKVLLSEDEERKRRLLREARAAAALGHAGVVAIYDVGEDCGRAFIAMERVRGSTLRERLDARPKDAPALPLDEARRVARDLARALAKAHGRGLVHRDMKPENVMIEADGRVILLDFGLAKATHMEIDPVSVATADGAIIGTPSYMSPEQARGKPVDARSDVFSFGVMLYEMLTGKRPFVGKNAATVLASIEGSEPTLPSTIRAGVDPDLERVALRCLQKEPYARYENAGAIAKELALDHDARKPGMTRFLAPAALVVLVLMLVAAIGASKIRSERAAAPLEEPSASTRVAAANALVPVVATDLPSSASQSEEARAAYRAGLESFRAGGSWGPDFQRAITLDPALASAHVQYAAIGMAQHLDGVRESFRQARAKSDALSPRDRALLDAIEPVVQREPADWAEASRRLGVMIKDHPGDAQLWYFLALGRGNFDDFQAAIQHLKRAIELDPQFARALSSLAVFEAYRGRFDEAQKAIDRCLEVAPDAMACLSYRARLEGYAGRCAAMESSARQMIARGAQAHLSYPLLADALASRGEPSATVEEALRHAGKQVNELPKGTAELVQSRVLVVGAMRKAALYGDFEAALEHARALGKRAEGSARRNDHGIAARAVAELLIESGKHAEAGAVALDYLDRQGAWEPDPSAEDSALSNDATPALLVTARKAGVITREGLAARRRAWLAEWSSRATPAARSYLWLHGWAATTIQGEDARDALEALAEHGPLPPYVPGTLVGASAGVTFMLGGRLDEAKRWLTQAAGSCSALSFPIAHTRAHLWLGQALEASGDTRGACASYRTVLDRWGRARPRSVTADEARERSTRLGCTR